MTPAEYEIQTLHDLLDEILEWALANRNSSSEFVRCYTYNHGDYPEWIYKVKLLLGEDISMIRAIYPLQEI